MRKVAKHQLKNVSDEQLILNSCHLIKAFVGNNPLPHVNDRGMEKIFSWAIFTAIYTHMFNKTNH